MNLEIICCRYIYSYIRRTCDVGIFHTLQEATKCYFIRCADCQSYLPSDPVNLTVTLIFYKRLRHNYNSVEHEIFHFICRPLFIYPFNHDCYAWRYVNRDLSYKIIPSEYDCLYII